MTNTIKHWAFNRTTGEVVGCNHVNALKRHVQHINRNASCFEPKPQWIFFHGSESEMRAWFEKRV